MHCNRQQTNSPPPETWIGERLEKNPSTKGRVTEFWVDKAMAGCSEEELAAYEAMSVDELEWMERDSRRRDGRDQVVHLFNGHKTAPHILTRSFFLLEQDTTGTSRTGWPSDYEEPARDGRDLTLVCSSSSRKNEKISKIAKFPCIFLAILL